MTTCRTSDTHDKSALTSAAKVNQGMNRKTDTTEITCKRLKIAWVTEPLKRRRLAMALKSVFAFTVLFLFTYCKAKPENCSETRCKLLPVGGGFPFEFLSKAFEEGVRMVYVHLKIGNDSYDPLDLKDEFLSHRWVWANRISEPMLSLSYDYDILSLGLLTYQVRSMDVHLRDQPRGCLANLNSTCQDEAVGRVLLNKTEYRIYGELPQDADVVCVAVIEKTDFYSDFFEGNVIYHCCAENKDEESSIQCDLVVKSSGWFKAFNGILNILTLVMILYSPAFLLALPDFIFNFREEYQKDVQRGQAQDNNNGSSEDNQALLDSPVTNEYGTINDSATIQVRESDPPQRRNESIQSQISGSGSSVGQPQQQAQDPRQVSENSELSTAEQSFVYLDDASPITCSTLFNTFTSKFKKNLIFFNVKLAFLCYLLIPIFYYVELLLNYAAKKVFVEEMFRKQEAFLPGPIFSFLSSKESLVLLGVSVPITLLSRPEDFKINGKCALCKGNDLFVGEELFQHMEQILVKTQELFFWLIKIHRKGIKKPIKWCTRLLNSFKCLKDLEPQKRFLRSVQTFCHFLCDAMVISFCGLFLGAVYLFSFFVGIAFLCLLFSPYITLGFAVYRKTKHLYCTQIQPRLPEKFLVKVSFYWSTIFFVCMSSALVMENLTVACFVGALSCRFIVKMFGYIIIGLVLNAEIASPFGTFVIAVSTNMYLCYYNLQKKYQEVKEMISQQWQKHKKDLLSTDDLSNSEEGTIPEDLFWHVCSDKSTSEHKVLPIRPEIYRMICNMVLILIFLVLALCSIIFLGNTYSISTVASIIAVFVTGVIPGLFFKGITKGNKFSGPTKAGMMKKIEKSVNEYIKRRNKKSTGSASQSQASSAISEERNESCV